ncbi:MAG TPA: COX15/CtaA family protein [Xanthobacteraceae bacterium]|nr:COX15/CtaA family protein [Xanthobacteraceae bacterium]
MADYPVAAKTGELGATREAGDALYVRAYLLLLALLSLAAFVFGIENRLTATGLYFFPPPVDWVPPLAEADWAEAFARHQQDPVFAACGGSGSIEEFRALYWWEWLRRLSMTALAATALAGLACAALTARFRFVLPRLTILLGLFVCYVAARTGIMRLTQSDLLASFNAGQYKHAVEVAFASMAVAAAFASAALPFRASRISIRRSEWLWIGAILLDICFGALFAARNASAFWPTLLGFEGRLSPSLDQLTSYSPLWLNFTFNQYTIQLVHRALSAGLAIAAFMALLVSLRRSRGMSVALVRFLLIGAQIVTGLATLYFGVPIALSIVHQVGAIFLLAASFVVLLGRTAEAKPSMIALAR